MRWFYVVIIAAFAAASAIGVAKVANHRPVVVEAIVAACLIIIFIALFGFLAKSRE